MGIAVLIHPGAAQLQPILIVFIHSVFSFRKFVAYKIQSNTGVLVFQQHSVLLTGSMA